MENVTTNSPPDGINEKTQIDITDADIINKIDSTTSIEVEQKERLKNLIFTIPCPNVPLSPPAQKRECGIFGPGMVKNSIRSTGVKAHISCLAPSLSARVAIYTRYGLSKFCPS